MINFDDCTNENKTEHNQKSPYIPDHPYRILIVGGSGLGKTNAFLNLINNQPDIDKIYLYAKDPYEAKHQYLINKREKVELDHFNDPKAFIDYSNDMQDVYKNIEDYNPNKKRKVLIAFYDMIADMINNKKLNPIVTELFIRGRKLNISIVFITQSYFKAPKDVRLNSTHFIMKIPNERELQQIDSNGIRTHNHLVRKRTLNHLRTTWLWVRIPLLSLKLEIWHLLRARSSLTFWQTIECGFTLKLVCDTIITDSHSVNCFKSFIKY